jgi:hypothetical protein
MVEMTHMNCTVDIEQKENYLHAVISGENSLANANASFNEIYGACIFYRCSKVLIESHLSGASLDSIDMFDLVKKNYVKANSIGMRMAIVDMVTSHDVRGLKFGENLALISGMNIRLFKELNEQEMVSWLMEL